MRAGGELTFLGELRTLANQLFPAAEAFPANLAQTWTADHGYAASLFRDYYLARADQYRLTGGCRYFTDKMPFNDLWLPLLQMAFPEAKIIRVIRHPLDVCVSMLSNHLTHGFNCGYRLHRGRTFGLELPVPDHERFPALARELAIPRPAESRTA